jgi:UDP:flavonoid glycosyltransferase YjiC (YdhE family)
MSDDPTRRVLTAVKESAESRLGVVLGLRKDLSLRVATVRDGSIMQAAGLLVNDILLTINGQPVPSKPSEATELLKAAPAGSLELCIRRGEIIAPPSSRPPPPVPSSRSAPAAASLIEQAVNFVVHSEGTAPLERRLDFLRRSKGLSDEQAREVVRLAEARTTTADVQPPGTPTSEPKRHVVFLVPGEAPGHIHPLLPLIRSFCEGGECLVTCFADGAPDSEREGEVSLTSPMGIALQAAGASLRFYRNDGRLATEERLNRKWWGRQFQRLPFLIDELKKELQPPPDVLLYDVYLAIGPIAARVCGIPCVGIITFSGPGMMTASESDANRAHFEPIREWLKEATGLELYEFGLPALSWYNSSTGLNLVCNIDELYAGLCTDAQRRQFGSLTFACVGTMIGPTDRRPAGGGAVAAQTTSADASLLEDLRARRAGGKRILLLSLGTMLVGPFWPPKRLPSNESGGNLGANDDGRGSGPGGATEEGKRRALSDYNGKEFAQWVWRVAADAFGDRGASDDGALVLGGGAADGRTDAGAASSEWVVVLSVGNKPDALEGIELPSNFLAFPRVPQLELLPICDAFVTHGGMGSVMEAVLHRVPMAVIPIFGDQIHNADAVQANEFGLSFRYPLSTLGAAALRRGVEAISQPGSAQAKALDAAARRLEMGGGAERARDLVLTAAARFDVDALE